MRHSAIGLVMRLGRSMNLRFWIRCCISLAYFVCVLGGVESIAQPNVAGAGVSAAANTVGVGKFKVPIIVKEKHPDLLEMLLQSPSIEDEDKQRWLDLIPDMSDKHIAQLRAILNAERDPTKEKKSLTSLLRRGSAGNSRTDESKESFKFVVPDEMRRRYPDVIDLVRNSESIDNNEKQYWYDIMPRMTEEQVGRLRTILETERRQLQELNAKYNEEIKKLNQKHRDQFFLNPSLPALRLETGSHLSSILALDTDSKGEYFVTAGRDKTARVWRLADGALHQVLRVPIAPGHEGMLHSVAIHPTLPIVAVGGVTTLGAETNDRAVVYLMARDGGEILAPLVVNGTIWQLRFIAGGEYVVAAISGGRAEIWRTSDRTRVAEMSDCLRIYFRGGDASEFLVVGRDTIRLVEVVAGRVSDRVTVPRQTFPGDDFSVAFSPDGTQFLIGDDAARVWRASARDLTVQGVGLYVDAPGVRGVPAMTWTSRDEVLLSYSHPASGKAPLLDGSIGGQTRLVAELREAVSQMKLLPDGRVLGASAEPIVGLYLPGGTWKTLVQRSGPYPDSEGALEPVMRASADGKRVELGLDYHRRDPHVFDLSARRFSKGADDRLRFSRGPGSVGAKVLIRNWRDHGKIQLGKRIDNSGEGDVQWKPIGLEVESTALASDDSSFVVGTAWSVRRFDRQGDSRWNSESESTIAEVLITPDDRLVLSVDSRGVAQWRRFSDGEVLLNFFPHVDGKRWVAWTPSGYYDASPDGEALIGWHINRGASRAPDFFPIEMFRDHFRRPGVVARILDTLDEDKAVALANADEGRAEKAGEVLRRLPPALRLASAPAKFDQTRVDIRVRPVAFADAPVFNYVVEVDGQVVAPERSLRRFSPDGTEYLRLRLPAKDVKVEVRAQNRHGYSVPLTLNLKWSGDQTTYDPGLQGDAVKPKPKLWVLAVGVGAYQDRALERLHFSARDAEAFAAALRHQKGRAYSDVSVEAITDSNATRARILEKVYWLRSHVSRGDVAMLFLSGHGITRGAEARYFFAPTDFDTGNAETTGIPDTLIRDALLDINNRGDGTRAFLFVDTCHAGSADQGPKLGAQRLSNAEELSDQLRRNARSVYVFASSSGDESSFEAPEFRQGAFTQAVVEGLSPPAWSADPYKDGRVTATGLADWIARRVPTILKHERQNPTFITPKSGISRVVVATRE